MPWPLIAAAAITVGASLLGARQQSKALRKSQKSQEAFQRDLLDFQRQIYGEGAPFREFNLSLLPELRGRFSETPESTVSPAFGLVGREGLDLLKSNFSTGGDFRSGPGQIAAGRFIEGLGTQEADRLIGQRNFQGQALLNLLGFGRGAAETATGQALSLTGPISGTAGNIADLTTAQGAVKGGLYGSLGQDLAQLSLLYGFGG